MIIILNREDLDKKIYELDAYRKRQFQVLCRNAFGENEKFFKVLCKHSVSELRKANGLGLDRFLAVTGEIR